MPSRRDPDARPAEPSSGQRRRRAVVIAGTLAAVLAVAPAANAVLDDASAEGAAAEVATGPLPPLVGQPPPPGPQPPESEQLLEQTRAHSQRAEGLMGRYEEQVQAIQEPGAEVWPDQEMALMRTSQELAETEAKVVDTTVATVAAINQELKANPGSPADVVANPQLDEVQELANDQATRIEQRSEILAAGAAPGFNERSDLERLTEQFRGVEDDMAIRDHEIGMEQPSAYLRSTQAAQELLASDSDSKREHGQRLQEYADARLQDSVEPIRVGAAQLVEEAERRRVLAGGTIKALTGSTEPGATERLRLAQQRYREAEIDLLGGRELLELIDVNTEGLPLIAVGIQGQLDPDAATAALKGSDLPSAVLSSERKPGGSYQPADAWDSSTGRHLHGGLAQVEGLVRHLDQVAEAELSLAQARVDAARAGATLSAEEEREHAFMIQAARDAEAVAYDDARFEIASDRRFRVEGELNDAKIILGQLTGETVDLSFSAEPVQPSEYEHFRDSAAGLTVERAQELVTRWTGLTDSAANQVEHELDRRRAPFQGPITFGAAPMGDPAGLDYDAPSGAVEVEGVGSDPAHGDLVIDALPAGAQVEVVANAYIARDGRCVTPTGRFVVAARNDNGSVAHSTTVEGTLGKNAKGEAQATYTHTVTDPNDGSQNYVVAETREVSCSSR